MNAAVGKLLAGHEKMKEAIVKSGLPKKLVACVSALSPSCKEAAKLQSRARAYPLTLTEQLGLRMHLFLCGWCRRYGEQVNLLRSTADPREELASSEHLSLEAKQRIEQKLAASRKLTQPTHK